MHTDALLLLNTLGKTHPYINDENLTLDLLLAQSTNTDPSKQLEHISYEDLLGEQLVDDLCTSVGSHPNGGKG